MFAKLGPWCHDRRRLVLGLWVAAIVLISGVAGGVGQDYKQDFSLSGEESTEGFDVLNEEFGGQGAAVVGTIVFEAEQGVRDPAVQSAMEGLFAEVEAQEAVSFLESPYQAGSERLVSESGQVAFANVEFPEDVEFTDAADVRDLILEDIPQVDGLNVELGGFIFAEFENPQTEAIGLAFAVVILILAFGSVLAMGLPVGVALAGIGIGSGLVILFSQFLTVPDFAPFIGLMIGLGVGIDYALLILTRYREQLHAGHDVRESVQIAIDTAGRSVLFAGLTVVISLLGQVVMGISFVSGMAVSAASTVAITILASLTLLPAFLGFAGANIERTKWRGLAASGFVALGLLGFGLDVPALAMLGFLLAALTLILGFWVARLKVEVAQRPPRPLRETLAYRWSRVIQRRPWTSALAGALVLLLLAVPVLGLRMASSDESNYPEDTTTRQAYELLVDGFGEGYNGEMFLVARLPAGTSPESLAVITEAVDADPDVELIQAPRPNDAGTAVVWKLVPREGPQEENTEELVNRLRDDTLPPLEEATGVDVLVTGIVAANIDFAHVLSERMPYFFAAVLILSFLLLMLVFRSLLVPLKAVIMNMLSIGAAYGVVVALFQWGWLSDLTDLQRAPIEPWAPMFLFAIVFGLSMDYEVFLLSRVREEWHLTGDSRRSVADGLAATAKVITAAAAIMVVVFGSFLLENDRVFKLMGTGLATAILLDATIVRLLLVPATMELLGDRNWWLPKWLDRFLPNIAVEGKIEAAAQLDHDDEQEKREPALTGGD